MASDETIEISITLDDGSLKKGFVKIEQDAARLGRAIGKGVENGAASSFENLASGLKKRFVAIAAGIASVQFFKGAISEATEAEGALNRLNIALSNSGQFTAETSARLQSLASSLQEVGTVTDDAVISGIQSLISIGNLSGQSLERATQAAVNLSAGIGVDLSNAFELVAKVSAGSTDALARYGLRIDQSIPKSERFAAVLGLIEQRFSGFDEARATTFGGAIQRLGNAFADFQQSIGEFVTKSPFLVFLINSIASGFNALATNISPIPGQLDVFGKSVSIVLFLLQTLNEIFTPVVDVIVNGFRIISSTAQTFASSIVTYFSGVALNLASIGNLIGVVSDATLAKVQAFAAKSFEFTAAAATEAGQNITTAFTNIPITEALTNKILEYDLFVQNLKISTVDFAATSATAYQQVGDSASLSFANIVNAFKRLNAEFKITARDVANTLRSTFITGVSNAFAALGRAFATGKNGLKEFGKSVLSTLGSLAIQIGSFFILTGLGMTATGPLLGLTGGAAIAAGIGLTILGGILQGLGGGGGEGAVVPGGGIASNTPGGGATAPEAISQPEDRERLTGTSVVVNVQGNILDRRESGLEIANVLQEFFDTNGGVLVRA